ncbi:uncharacterized protein V1516DRAFT_622130 [Lipomyces oligophaga]|uniref:uncharacterized protein n=1 Tax=Lipomyces oligophaga TaxID=45792 RepID=UPI0034CEBFD7
MEDQTRRFGPAADLNLRSNSHALSHTPSDNKYHTKSSLDRGPRSSAELVQSHYSPLYSFSSGETSPHPLLQRQSSGSNSAGYSEQSISSVLPTTTSSTIGSCTTASFFFPPPPIQNLAATPLLDETEANAYSAFLDKMAIADDDGDDLLLDPSVSAHLIPLSGKSYSTADIFGGLRQTSLYSKLDSFNLPLQPIPGVSQKPLPLIANEQESVIHICDINDEDISAEDRAGLLRAAFRHQELAFGSDPQFSKSGFIPDLNDCSVVKQSRNSGLGGEAAASEILQNMSKHHRIGSTKLEKSKTENPSPPSLSSSSSSPILTEQPTEFSAINQGSTKVQINAPTSTYIIRKTENAMPQSTHSQSGRKRRQSISGSTVQSSTLKDQREILTEAQRRKNHIYSEKKRRDIIKHGFEELTQLIPVLRPGGFSKSAMLTHLLDFLSELEVKNRGLENIVDSLQHL